MATALNLPAQIVGKRLDIQGLRALAVVAVVVYHFFPGKLPGGFVGVDIFFVISGFLITSLLLREIENDKRINLTRFYARRVKRLLPASSVTIVVTLLVAGLVAGPVRMTGYLHDAAWTSLYLANFRFAADVDGYFAVADPSPFRHFWSLAVEEQFYLVWPLLLVACLLLGRRSWRKRLTAMLIAVIGMSLTASILLTDLGSTHAYFSLGTRAWELGIGGALAYGMGRWTRAVNVRCALTAQIVGFVMIAYTLATFSSDTPFPGWTAAVPVVGTALMIFGGSYSPATVLTTIMAVRPIQIIGDASYSLYLWHWPILILGSQLFDLRSTKVKLSLLCLSFFVGWLSYKFIERPSSRWLLHWPTRRTLPAGVSIAAAIAACSLAIASLTPATTGVMVNAIDRSTTQAVITDRQVELSARAIGPAPKVVPANVAPPLADLPSDLAEVFSNGCFAAELVVCEGGDLNSSTTIVLAGDSQAGHWWSALSSAGLERGWKIYLVGKNGCPFADVSIPQGDTTEAWPECSAWQQDAREAIEKLDADLVIYANHTQGYSKKAGMDGRFEELWETGVTETLLGIAERNPILFFGQFPIQSQDPVTCLEENLGDISECGTQRDIAVQPEITELNMRLANELGATYFDLSSLLCEAKVCPVLSDNQIMYRDSAHLSNTFSLFLSGILGKVVAATLEED